MKFAFYAKFPPTKRRIIQMWEKALPWIGGVFAAVGLVLIFIDIITSIKKRNKTKTNVVGLVVLSVAVVGYTITDLILKDSAWPPLASLVWIALFWVYVIMDACVTMGVIKKVRRDKKTAASVASDRQYKQVDLSHMSIAEQEKYATDHSEGGLIWKQLHADQIVAVEVPTDDTNTETK